MKGKLFPDRSPKEKAYFGVFLVASLVFLVVALLRTAGVVAGGPVPWWVWVSVGVSIPVNCYVLFGKKRLFASRKAEDAVLLILYSGIMLMHIFKDGLPVPGTSGFRTLLALGFGLALIPLAILHQKEELKIEAELERKRQEKLAELRRSMAPTKQEDGQSASNRAAQDASDGQQSPP